MNTEKSKARKNILSFETMRKMVFLKTASHSPTEWTYLATSNDNSDGSPKKTTQTRRRWKGNEKVPRNNMYNFCTNIWEKLLRFHAYKLTLIPSHPTCMSERQNIHLIKLVSFTFTLTISSFKWSFSYSILRIAYTDGKFENLRPSCQPNVWSER